MTVYARSDWTTKNNRRKYPLDDLATAAAVDDGLLPESFITDLHIYIPRYVYETGDSLTYAYISSATCSENAISLTLLGATKPLRAHDGGGTATELTGADFVPLAVLNLPTSTMVPYRNYAISPLLEGVHGWISFGSAHGDGLRFALRFEPTSALLAPQAVQPYDYAPVTSVTGGAGFTLLHGDIALEGTGPLSIDLESRYLGGEASPRQVVVINMDPDSDTLSAYTGPCGGRPESNTCNNVPIISLGGVTPDCEGNVTLDISGVQAYLNAEGGGLCLDTNVNVYDACARTLPDALGNIPGSTPSLVPLEACTLNLPFNTDDYPYVPTSQLTTLLGSFYDSGEEHTFYGDFGGEELALLQCCLQSIDSGYSKTTLTMITRTDSLHDGDDTQPGAYLFRNKFNNMLVLVRLRGVDEEVIGRNHKKITINISGVNIDTMPLYELHDGSSNKDYYIDIEDEEQDVELVIEYNYAAHQLTAYINNADIAATATTSIQFSDLWEVDNGPCGVAMYRGSSDSATTAQFEQFVVERS